MPSPTPASTPPVPLSDRDRLALLEQATCDVVLWVVDAIAQRGLYISPAYEAMFGQPVSRLMENPLSFLEVVHPDDRQHVVESFTSETLVRPVTAEYRIVRASGEVRWVQTRATPTFDRDNRICRVSGITHDITEEYRRQEELAEREQHYRQLADTNRRLLDEANHRVRNNLSGLIGLLQFTRRETQEVDAFAQAMHDRIVGLAQGHNLLVASEWKEIDFRSIIDRVAGSMHPSAPHGIHMSLEGPTVQVAPRQAVPLAMAFTELFTNSIKYGACSATGGRIDIRWTVARPDHQIAHIDLTWTEIDGPPINSAPKQSLGTELIEGFIRFELQGECQLNYPREGARHRLRIPFGASAQIAPAATQPDNA